jgi:ubiquinone/menaquinone biosynthesis C-methylase UbiE
MAGTVIAGPQPRVFFDGAAYERVMGRWSRIAGDLFLTWLAPATRLRWLDVGCGNGAFTECATARFAPAEMHGIDPSEGQLSYARMRAETSGAFFRQGDAQALPYADANFDIATMALAISFVPDPAKAVLEMTRVVRPRGLVAAYMWDQVGGGLPLEPLRRELASLGAVAEGVPHPETGCAEELQRLWREAGLESIDSCVIEIETAYRDFDDFWGSNVAPGSPVANQIATLPPNQVERLRARLRDNLKPDAKGRIVLPARANAIKGIRPR